MVTKAAPPLVHLEIIRRGPCNRAFWAVLDRNKHLFFYSTSPRACILWVRLEVAAGMVARDWFKVWR